MYTLYVTLYIRQVKQLLGQMSSITIHQGRDCGYCGVYLVHLGLCIG